MCFMYGPKCYVLFVHIPNSSLSSIVVISSLANTLSGSSSKTDKKKLHNDGIGILNDHCETVQANNDNYMIAMHPLLIL